MTRTLGILTGTALCLLLAAPAFALGPVDVEAGVVYWMQDVEFQSGASSFTVDGDDVGLFAQVWIGDIAVRGAQYSTGVGEMGLDFSIDWQSVDVRWKAFELTDSNYIALGAGIQRISIDDAGGSDESAGFRLAAEAHFGLGRLIAVYGDAAYYLEMDDFDGGGTDVDGYEVEFGVSVKPAPFLNLRAGYRTSTIDYTFGSVPREITPDGFLAGVTINF
ncbi:MAG: hypothetical protein Kow0062_12320 [Acidobacteriota bacterium]